MFVHYVVFVFGLSSAIDNMVMRFWSEVTMAKHLTMTI